MAGPNPRALLSRYALLSLASLSLLAGCDPLRARFVARDGVDLYHKGAYAQAAAKFEEATRLDATMPTLQLNLGTAHLGVLRSEGTKSEAGREAAAEAIRAFERYLALKPKDERVKLSLVQTFVDTGRYDDAVTYFKPDVERTPPDPEAVHTLAVIAAKCGKFDEARRWYERHTEIAPRDADAFLALGVHLWEQLHAHPEMDVEPRKAMVESALRALERAIALKPAAPNAYTYANLVYRERVLAEPDDDGKRIALQQANRYYQLALERQH
jgi:tetratricopeptide (TPR) repeat protein